MESFRIDISAPNIMNVCIDGQSEYGKSGRMYCCYHSKERFFENELQLIQMMEALMDQLNYPQQSMDIRRYEGKKVPKRKEKPEPVLSREKIVEKQGKMGTFIIHVQYRQNATWQGRMIHKENGEVIEFRSVLELLKILDNEIYDNA